MARRQNTDIRGNGFTTATVSAVWQKAAVVTGYDPAVWRKDACGASMRRTDYGDTTSKYGWEIDHIRPVAAGGTDDMANLQALRWENNRHKSDSYPQWSCKVRAA